MKRGGLISGSYHIFSNIHPIQTKIKTLWVRYLTSQHLRSQTFEISVLLIATAGALRKISSTASAIVKSDSKRGFPGGSPVSYYTNNVFLKKNTIWYMAIWHIMCKYAQYQPFKQLLGFLLNMWLLQSFTRRNSACLQKLPKNYHITTYDPGITHHMGKHYCSVQALPSSIQCMQLCGNENTQQQFMQWT